MIPGRAFPTFDVYEIVGWALIIFWCVWGRGWNQTIKIKKFFYFPRNIFQAFLQPFDAWGSIYQPPIWTSIFMFFEHQMMHFITFSFHFIWVGIQIMFGNIYVLLIVCEFRYINKQIVKNGLFHGKIYVPKKDLSLFA